ncbi:MAG: hypothetical protein D6809_05790 [Gammaproteobacteria bacterium]|nr:MAG: hypothetical protein D6809_05790 [Gammaproteobacteria bacterium]
MGAGAPAGPPPSRWRWSGYLKNETAYRFRRPRSITKIRNLVALNLDYELGPAAMLHLAGWAYHDLAYNLFDYDTIAARLERNAQEPLAFVFNLPHEKDSPVAEVRELYLDASWGPLDLRLGKQFVVWGVLEGVRIVDEINPMDFRELILLDLLDYRIPLWTAKLDYYAGPGSVELLWIPDIRFHKPAPPGSEWELLQEVPGTRNPERFDPRNSELGLRLSAQLAGADLALSYFYTWDDYPTVFRRVRLDRVQTPRFMPTHTRLHIYGLTYSNQLSWGVLKAELAFVRDKYFAIAGVDRNGDGFLDHNGELKRKHLRWGLGLDLTAWGADISPSVTQWVIFDYDPAIIQDRYSTGVNLFVRKPLGESVLFQFLGIGLVDLGELYLRPRWSYRVTDRFQVTTGLDLFYGRRSQFGVAFSVAALSGVATQPQRAQFLGNFRDNDRLVLEFKYAF